MSNQTLHCRECGSAALDMPLITGGVVTCKVCGWRGTERDLLATGQLGMTNVQVLADFAYGLQKVLQANLNELFSLLVEYSFVDSSLPHLDQTKQFARYGKALIPAMAKAITDEHVVQAQEARAVAKNIPSA